MKICIFDDILVKWRFEMKSFFENYRRESVYNVFKKILNSSACIPFSHMTVIRLIPRAFLMDSKNFFVFKVVPRK